MKDKIEVNKDIDINIKIIQEAFENCGDVVDRKLPIGEDKNQWLYITYIDMLVNRSFIEENILSNLMIDMRLVPSCKGDLKENMLESLKNGGLTTADLKESTNIAEMIQAMLTGDTVLLLDSFEIGLIISSKGWPNRGVPQASTEVVVQGSKEAFNEVFRVNTTLIRRRIRDTNLKVQQLRIGRRSLTDIGVMYLKDVVRKEILSETLDRLNNIDIDGILDCGYIEQLIEDDWMSPFPQMETTERPDKAASAILEGRIVIIVDNSPFVLIVPATLNTFYQASEDHYQRWHIMSLVRLLRYIAGFLALCLPALYLATAVYHPSMLPTTLTYKMAASRQSVPFPAVIEIVLMDLAFELLKESGIRLPNPIGSTMGVVGGIVMGQAAVEAGLVSPIVVIIIALTGISSFAIPTISLVNGYRITKYVLIFFAASLGLFGFWIGLLLVLIHLVSLKSFGIPYMFPFSSGDINEHSDDKDTLFRLPIFMMKYRPIFANPKESIRLNTKKTGKKKRRSNS